MKFDPSDSDGSVRTRMMIDQFRRRASKYPTKEIEAIVDEAVRAEEKSEI